MTKVTHGKTLEVEPKHRHWTAAQVGLEDRMNMGGWNIHDEDGDLIFTLPAALIPRGSANGVVNLERLEMLIDFIFTHGKAARDVGERTGIELCRQRFRELLGLEDLHREFSVKPEKE